MLLGNKAFAETFRRPKNIETGESDEADTTITRLDVSALPDDLAAAFISVQQKLEQGELESALDFFDKIKQILRDVDRFD